MSRARIITDTVHDLEFEVAKQKAVQKEFPDAKVHWYSGFNSKDVNQKYTKFDFDSRPYGLWVMPYCEVNFEFDDKTHTVKVHSAPKANRLAYLSYSREFKGQCIKFSRVAINMKSNAFKDDMLNTCRTEIMKFIQDHPGYKLDQKHLEPRLKKLLAFV